MRFKIPCFLGPESFRGKDFFRNRHVHQLPCQVRTTWTRSPRQCRLWIRQRGDFLHRVEGLISGEWLIADECGDGGHGWLRKRAGRFTLMLRDMQKELNDTLLKSTVLCVRGAN